MNISKQPFGSTDGQPVDLYTLSNGQGAEARILNYGGIVVSLTVPDKHGQPGDVVLGCDDLDGYAKAPHFGSIVGRYANRIAKGRFTLEGRPYTLATNNPPNALHGGIKGFDKVVWRATPRNTADGPALELRYVSPDGEEGYPGTLTVTAVYTLTRDHALRLDFTSTTDQPTVCNLSHHSYFNLAGHGDILDHEVYLNASRFTPVDATMIPTGELKSVAGTPFDFRQPTAIGARINNNDEQLKLGGGYDHNWVVDKPPGEPGLQARVFEATSGRVVEVWSTQPGVQFYTGNFLDGTLTGKGGWFYQRRQAFCLEPQHFPDSPNQPSFPTTELKPGETYRHAISYKFSVR